MNSSANLALLVLPHGIDRKCALRPQGLGQVSQTFPFSGNVPHSWGLTGHQVAFSYLRKRRCRRMGRAPRVVLLHVLVTVRQLRVSMRTRNLPPPRSPCQHPTDSSVPASCPSQCSWWLPTAFKAAHTRHPRLPQLHPKSGLQTKATFASLFRLDGFPYPLRCVSAPCLQTCKRFLPPLLQGVLCPSYPTTLCSRFSRHRACRNHAVVLSVEVTPV